MIYFAMFMILAWVPIVIAIFGVQRPRDAVILSFLFAWLFLPTIGFDIPGMPDYTKMTATTLGVLLSIFIFDSGRLFAFRPRWYDLPITSWCLCPFISAVTNGQGAYDGVSAVVQEVVNWGIPYLIGRLYLSDPESLRRMSLGMAISGLLYIVPCLIEIRLAPVFDVWVYGLAKWEGERRGTYRPHVFLSGGLELGMWMTCASLAIVTLWTSGAAKRIWNVPIGVMTVALVATTYMVKATGAFILLIVGISFIRLARLTKTTWPAWVLVMVTAVYCTTRLSGLWSGAELVAATEATTDGDRTQSVRFRFEQEEILFRSAFQRPIFGWARAGGFNRNANGTRTAITDGFWIVTLGNAGFVGLTSLWMVLCLPLALTARRFPAKTWNDPDVAPIVAMAVMLSLYMIDCLSNGMLNPIYPLIAGGLVGLSKLGRDRSSPEIESALESGRELVAAGRPELAEARFRQILDQGQGSEVAAGRDEALAGLGLSLLAAGRHDEAVQAYRDLVDSRLSAASEGHDPALIGSLAAAHEGLARALARLGEHGRAIEQRLKAIDLWSGVVGAYPEDASFARKRAGSLNDLAWLLAADSPPGLQDPVRAAELASEAARAMPNEPTCWNTLGVALYRAGDFLGSVDALGRSIDLGPAGGTAFDHYFLAMASCQLGDLDHAIAWYEQAVDWTRRHGPDHPRLAGFRREASQILEAAGLANMPHRA